MALTRRQVLALGIAGAGIVAVAGSRRAKRSLPRRPAPPTPRVETSEERIAAAGRIRRIAGPLADAIGMPGLPDFLVAVAWTESRWNPRAGGDTGNLARGWFGMRPTSARLKDAGLPVSALKDERASVALITWYLHRLQPFAERGQEIDWLALRRGMAFPFLVADTDEDMSTPRQGPGVRSGQTRRRLEQALDAAGLDESFMFRSAFPPGYAWIGIENALDVVGAGGIA